MGGPAGKSKSTTTTTTTTTTTPNLEYVGPKGWGPEESAPSLRDSGLCLWGLGFFGFRKFGQNTKTLKLAKVGLAKVGLARVGHDRRSREGSPRQRAQVRGTVGGRQVPFGCCCPGDGWPMEL